jgi:hypothetical protein
LPVPDGPQMHRFSLIRATPWQALIYHVPDRASRIAIAELFRGGQDTPHPDVETWLTCGAVRGDEVAQWNLA